MSDPIFGGVHEDAIAFASGLLPGQPPGPTQGRWLVGFNANSNITTLAGWAYTDDATATSWHSFQMQNPLDFGYPGVSPSNGSAFQGWRGDPSVAAVTDPTSSNGFLRVLYTNVAISAAGADDVIVARSDDGGATWGGVGGATYVNTASTGGGVDNPVIASDPANLNSTFVAWTASGGGWINRITVAQNGTMTPGIPVHIPAPPAGHFFHPGIAIGRYTSCKGSHPIHEAVFVAYAQEGCCRCSGTQSIFQELWWLTMYDVQSGKFYGPWLLFDTGTPTYPICVGSAGTPPGSGYASNDVRPHIAVDSTQSSNFYVSHTVPTAGGTRAQLDFGSIGCSGGNPSPSVSHVTSPDPCDFVPGIGCTQQTGGPGGGPIIQDEWGPQVSMGYNNGVPRVVMTYYTTRDDVNNTLVDQYMMYSENKVNFSQPVQISIPASGQTIPWDHTLAPWDDYQGLGVTTNGVFLSAWGGDARLSNSPGIWSTILQ